MTKRNSVQLIKMLALMLSLFMVFGLLAGCQQAGSEVVEEVIVGEDGEVIEGGTASGASTASGKTSGKTSGGTTGKTSGAAGGTGTKVTSVGKTVFNNAKVLTIAAQFNTGPDKTKSNYSKVLTLQKNIEKQYGITMKFLTIPQWDVYTNNYISKVNAKDALADFCFVDEALMYPNFIVKGLVQQLNATDWQINDTNWDKKVCDDLKYDGKYYMVATKGKYKTPANALVFNKRLIKQALGDENALYKLQANKQWTWDKFKEVAKELDKISGVVPIGSYGPCGSMLATGFMDSTKEGGWLKFDIAAKKATYNLEHADSQRALNFVYDMIVSDKLGEVYGGNVEWSQTLNQFTTGKLGIMAIEYWQTTILKDQKKGAMKNGDKFGVVNFPIAPGMTDYQAVTSKGTVIVVPPAIKAGEASFKNKVKALIEYFRPKDSDPSMEIGEEYSLCDTESIQSLKLIEPKIIRRYGFATFNRDAENLVMNNLDYGMSKKTTPQKFAQSIKAKAEAACKKAFQ